MSAFAPIRTLLVDDEPAVLALHSLYLSDLGGFEATATASSAEDAARVLESTAIDLVLLDESMPLGAGTTLLSWLRSSRARGVDVIMITASQEFATVEAARLGGVADYLVKPFAPELFRQRLLAFAARREERAGAAAKSVVAQEQVDAVLGLGAAPTVSGARSVPKGLAPETARLVAAAIAGGGGELTAVEVAELCGLSRVTARRYLDFLASTGIVLARPRYGRRGRPVMGYSGV